MLTCKIYIVGSWPCLQDRFHYTEQFYFKLCDLFDRIIKNVIYERLVFNRRNQQEGERIDHFVSELKRLALTCDFDSLKDFLIRDRIVGGVFVRQFKRRTT